MEDETTDLTSTTLEGVPLVRLAADDGVSPVWAWEAVGYGDLALPEELERRLRAWESAHRAAWRDGRPGERVVQRHVAEGALLAILLAEHLGRGLAVEFGCPVDAGDLWGGPDGRLRWSLADPWVFHANVPARDPAAAARVRRMVLHPFEMPGECADYPPPVQA
ncbi:MAG: hypothetical protein ABWX68_14560 [Arthrobacter sp.]|uniref:hypothetical protein n=1 Tax=Arthrobacter sp. TaxID=1667 RepID=UPI0034981FEB